MLFEYPVGHGGNADPWILIDPLILIRKIAGEVDLLHPGGAVGIRFGMPAVDHHIFLKESTGFIVAIHGGFEETILFSQGILIALVADGLVVAVGQLTQGSKGVSQPER